MFISDLDKILYMSIISFQINRIFIFHFNFLFFSYNPHSITHLFISFFLLNKLNRDTQMVDQRYDIVYAWVNGSDLNFQDDLTKWSKLLNETIKTNKFREWDEIKYSLRSIYTHASSFYNNIYIITNGQVPNWLKRNHPKVRIITHQELFSLANALEYLPTFSSMAIGYFLCVYVCVFSFTFLLCFFIFLLFNRNCSSLYS